MVTDMVIMIGDFNIRDSDWDPNTHHHSMHTKDLLTIADSLGLELSPPINPRPTRFTDNRQNTDLVLDLVFLAPNNTGFGKHILHPEICKPSNHIPLLIKVGIREENIDIIIQSIRKDSDEKKDFIETIKSNIRILDITSMASQMDLQVCTNQLSDIFNKAWIKHSKLKYITKYSKE